jgi:hypothetical protein
MRFRLFKVLLFLPVFSFAQPTYFNFRNLTCPEKWWVVFHPFVAKKAYAISREARSISKEMEQDIRLDHDADGGQVDAFRHSYWMARLAQDLGWRKARSLGKAHERGNYNDFKSKRAGEEIFADSIAGAMDLFNNKVGIEAGRQNKSVSKEALKELICTKIIEGQMKIILKDPAGNSLDCERNIVDLKKYSGIWNIPRCLVSSAKK